MEDLKPEIRAVRPLKSENIYIHSQASTISGVHDHNPSMDPKHMYPAYLHTIYGSEYYWYILLQYVPCSLVIVPQTMNTNMGLRWLAT